MKHRLWPVCLFLLVVAVGACLVWRPLEPVYRGHSISYWIEPWQHHGTEPAENIAAAFDEMDERAVRWLAAQLDWRPSPLRATLNRMVARVISAKFLNDPPDRREVAAMGLGRLGPRAASAVKALEGVLRRTAEPRASVTRAAALGALIRIRREPLEPYIEKLRDSSAPDWPMYAMAMWHLGTNAAPAVPALVEALDQAPRLPVVGTAVSALATIHSRPELTVPALTRQLEHPAIYVRLHAVRGLGLFGPAALSAWTALLPRLQDTELPVRQAATNALKQIAPEAARQHGIH